ncbi:unnamed protein product, partial [Effrenium voratum]
SAEARLGAKKSPSALMEPKEAAEQAVRRAFAAADQDGSGFIEREELKALLGTLNPDLAQKEREVDRLIKISDSDKDGKISIEEFCHFVFSSGCKPIHTWHLEDGRVQQKFLDGRVRMTFLDGCTVDQYKDGTRIQVDADGSCTVEQDGRVFSRLADGTCITHDPASSSRVIQVNPNGDRTVTDVSGRVTTYFKEGATVEEFDTTQAKETGVATVQRCASGALLVLYTDSSRIQFNLDGSQLETGVGWTLVRLADGSGRKTSKATGTTQSLSAEAVLAEIESGRSKLLRSPSALPSVKFSALACGGVQTLQATPEESTARPEPASAKPLPKAKAKGRRTNVRAAKDELLKSERLKGVQRETYASGLVVERYADGTILEKTPSGQSKQQNPDGTVIIVDEEAKTETTIKPTGTSITKHADGLLVQRSADGTSICTKADGTVMQTNPDGSQIVSLPSGERTKHLRDGTTLHTWPSGEKRQTFPDGCVIVTHEDGSTKQTDADGTEIVTQVDGSYTIQKPGGLHISAYASGEKLQRNPDGTLIRSLPDGRQVQKNPNGVVIETLADGTFRQCEPNGSGFELSADNRRQRDFLPGALSATMDGVSGTESGKWKHK